jgi:rod shape-determining protein MreC
VSTLSARQTILLVVLFVLTSISFIVLDNRHALDPLRNGVHSLVLPVTESFNGIGDGSSDETDLQKKYDDLQAKYDKLQADYAQLLVNAREVDQLRKMLDLEKSQPNVRYVPARVLYPGDPTNTLKFVIIDKGSADGIKEGMAVTDPNYYVGLVTKVDEHESRVMLAIDSSQSVGAELLSSRGVGIAWGMWQKSGRIEIRHVPRSVTPQQGEVVTTACDSEASTALVPCGLIIGIVSGAPVVDNQGDTQTIPILPAADFNNLSVVAVIISDASASPADTAGTPTAGDGTQVDNAGP